MPTDAPPANMRLLGEGPTPWHALRDLAINMHGTQSERDAMHSEGGEFSVRVMQLKVPLQGAKQHWIAEAAWYAKG